jgi:transposase-like protein
MNTTNDKIKTPKTLMEAVKYFADLEIAHQFFVNVRWPHGVVCPTCGSTGASYIPKYRRYQCNHNHDRRQFTVKTGSVMEDSPLRLDTWAIAFWLEVNAKNSISSCELARALGITQKSAWFVLHRCRHALHVGSFDKKLVGVIEADETFVGGLAKNMHKAKRAEKIKGTGGSNKTAVMGLLARHDGKKHSTVRAEVLPNVRRQTLHSIIHKNVEPGSAVYTDAWQAYRNLGPEFVHDFVDHAEAYVKDKVVHTNGLENFWALFKRCIKGTHISIEPFHLAAYVDSEAYRFNNRKTHDYGRFVSALPGISGKRLDYRTLIGKNIPESDTASGNAAESGFAGDC